MSDLRKAIQKILALWQDKSQSKCTLSKLLVSGKAQTNLAVSAIEDGVLR